MAGILKKTTGLTGLKVIKNPHYVLNALYGKIIRVLDKLPQDYAYRRYTEQIIKERANIVKNNTEVKAVEDTIGCGQIEELIMQAENELALARHVLVWKPWEPLLKDAPPNQWTWPPHK